jgi:hypothetical protein
VYEYYFLASPDLQLGWTERQITIFVALAFHHADDHALAIDVADLQACALAIGAVRDIELSGRAPANDQLRHHETLTRHLLFHQQGISESTMETGR